LGSLPQRKTTSLQVNASGSGEFSLHPNFNGNAWQSYVNVCMQFVLAHRSVAFVMQLAIKTEHLEKDFVAAFGLKQDNSVRYITGPTRAEGNDAQNHDTSHQMGKIGRFSENFAVK
jgi:hypothetical protein